MHVNEEDLLNEWQKFIKFGIRPKSVEKNIIASWERSKDMGIDPYKCIPGKRLTENELSERISLKKDYLRTIIPYLDKIHESVKGEGYVFYLADELGYVLYITGSDNDKSYLDKHFYFRNGVSCEEEIVGTTAASLVLSEKIIVSHLSSAKYCLELKNTTCSALPLFDSEGKFIGILGVATSFRYVNKHMLGILLTAKMGIENQLRLIDQNKKLYILNNLYGNYFGSSSDAVVFVDCNGKIVSANRKASEIINERESDIVGKKVMDVLDFPAVLFDSSAADYSYKDCIIDTRNEKAKYKFSKQITCFRYSSRNDETLNIFKEYSLPVKHLVDERKPDTDYTFRDLIGNNDIFLQVIEQARKASVSNSNILITGESGTGKELLAHSIHNESSRAGKSFIPVNCSAISQELAESEFFGYEGGAFTGADKKGKKGFFEIANGGTVFLDEIGEMPRSLQTKLLRVLQNKKLMRTGGTKQISVDFRLIAATNKNIEKEVESGNFRNDLYYRLNVIRLHMPDLLQRKSDIIILANFFINKHLQARQQNVVLDKEVEELLKKYDWPGNIRELENVIEHAMVFLGDEKTITFKHLPDYFIQKQSYFSVTRNGSLFEDETEKIRNALKESRNNITLAAKILGISRNTLYKKIREHNINCSDT